MERFCIWPQSLVKGSFEFGCSSIQAPWLVIPNRIDIFGQQSIEMSKAWLPILVLLVSSPVSVDWRCSWKRLLIIGNGLLANNCESMSRSACKGEQEGGVNGAGVIHMQRTRTHSQTPTLVTYYSSNLKNTRNIHKTLDSTQRMVPKRRWMGATMNRHLLIGLTHLISGRSGLKQSKAKQSNATQHNPMLEFDPPEQCEQLDCIALYSNQVEGCKLLLYSVESFEAKWKQHIQKWVNLHGERWKNIKINLRPLMDTRSGTRSTGRAQNQSYWFMGQWVSYQVNLRKNSIKIVIILQNFHHLLIIIILESLTQNRKSQRLQAPSWPKGRPELR